jgi:hypothetical protein
MKLLDEYFELQEKIFSYFGYVENWRVLPLDDCREYYWFLTGEGYGDKVCFAKTEKELAEQGGGNYYENEIYTQRHLPKWVYRGAEYTLVVVDTHTDDNKLLSVFANSKEQSNTRSTEDGVTFFIFI